MTWWNADQARQGLSAVCARFTRVLPRTEKVLTTGHSGSFYDSIRRSNNCMRGIHSWRAVHNASLSCLSASLPEDGPSGRHSGRHLGHLASRTLDRRTTASQPALVGDLPVANSLRMQSVVCRCVYQVGGSLPVLQDLKAEVGIPSGCRSDRESRTRWTSRIFFGIGGVIRRGEHVGRQ